MGKVGKCSICFGFGLWAVGRPSPVGPIDFSDGVEGKKCPECGASGKHCDYWKTSDGRIIYYKHLETGHLKNILDDYNVGRVSITDKLKKKLESEYIRRLRAGI